MTLETKTNLLEVVEYAAQKLNITSKGKLYLELQGVLENATVSEMETVDYNFDLPEVKGVPAVTRPRVHIMEGSACGVACEG